MLIYILKSQFIRLSVLLEAKDVGEEAGVLSYFKPILRKGALNNLVQCQFCLKLVIIEYYSEE